ncbi:MAG: arginine--tRNA ligase [Alphaproteobacteria bacterium]|nr:arginine--tRNA ligase [Alphaproteobacteria bacterium]
MNLFEIYRTHVLAAVEAVLPGVNTDAITLEPPREAAHGDLSTNAAMVLAGQVKAQGGKANPREIAEKLAEKLRAVEGVVEVVVAGPGFINFTLAPDVWQAVLPVILSAGKSYGNSRIGAGRNVNVEYVSANPTGPLHIGHARGAVYGDALATLLLKSGHTVTKEYYVNDAGAQVEVLARSALLRYREALGEDIGAIPEGLYPGEYLKSVGAVLQEMHGARLLDLPMEEQIAQARGVAIDAMMALIKSDLADMGIHHDVFTSEARLHRENKVDAAIALLTKKGHVYRGVLEPPKGEKVEDWEPQEQLLFRSSAFGDDADRTLEKADGSRTYFAGDLALTMDKVERGFDTLIYMFGADHGGYVKRMEASAAALSDGAVAVDIKLCQLVHLTKNGEPVRMSKRAGNFVTARDVLDEVGKNILRFVMLIRKTNQDMDFDLDKVKEQSKDNPVFYVQYAHARAKSVLRLAREQMPEAFAASEKAADFSLLSHPAELTLIKLLAGWPRLVEQAAVAHEPHRIVYYLQELAACFHGLWNVGSKDADIRFVQAGQPALTTARLALARALAVVVASGLDVCGVEPVEELR